MEEGYMIAERLFLLEWEAARLFYLRNGKQSVLY